MVSKFIAVLAVIAIVTILAVAVAYMADQGVFTPPEPTPTPIPTATPIPTTSPSPTPEPTFIPIANTTTTSSTPTIEVTPTSTPALNNIKIYYLGNKILDDWQHEFYFHGWTHVYQNGDWLLIGHYYYDSMSNIEFELNKGMTFHLRDYEYKVVDYGPDWIKLIEVK
jgi:hypothetical protein